MNQAWIEFEDVSFSYDTSSGVLIESLSAHFPVGWTGIIGANGAGKTTILKLAAGCLTPQQGRLTTSGQSLYCAQRTDDPPAHFDDFVHSPDAEALELGGRMGIEPTWLSRWSTLSHGERKRAQVGVALWLNPDVLALDEPTNHIDTYTRAIVASALQLYRGAGLLVSHDRTLLDKLCKQCLFVDPPDLVMRPGNYSEGVEQARHESLSKARQRSVAKRVRANLEREVSRRRSRAATAGRKRSKRGIGRKDHDAKSKIDLARVSGKDGKAGRLMRQLVGRLRQAERRLDETKTKKEHHLGIWMPGTYSRREFLFRLPAGSVPMGEERRLHFPDLVMRRDSRVALTGPNGSGKSTLLNHIKCQLDIGRDKLIFIPQELRLERSKELVAQVRALNNDTLAHLMAIVSRLNSRPERLLETDEPSPGEIRKVLLALGIAKGPHLIVMDEPTNHLDLPSTLCLEQALADCPCGLLLVSHDKRFVERLAETRWHIGRQSVDSHLTIDT